MQLFNIITVSLAILSSLSATLAKPIDAGHSLLTKRAETTSEDIQAILDTHNKYRAMHDAPPLTWGEDLASFASNWANQCSVSHSGSPYGENIAGRTQNWENTVDAWYNEVSDYDFESPGYDFETGHFTQVVWKNTKSVGCAAAYCDNIKGSYYICEYEPRGNVIWGGTDPIKFFRTNVTAPNDE